MSEPVKVRIYCPRHGALTDALKEDMGAHMEQLTCEEPGCGHTWVEFY